MTGITVRPAAPGDAPAVAAIFDHYVVSSHATFECEPRGAAGQEQRIAAAGTGLDRLLVAEEDGVVAGWAGSSMVRPRPAYAHSAEVAVYAAPGATGRGVGRMLLASLLEDLRRAGAHRAYAVVALPNPASVALFEGAGFTRLGTMSEAGRKFDRWWDVAWYEHRW